MQPFSPAFAALLFFCSTSFVLACGSSSGGPPPLSQVDDSALTNQPKAPCASNVDSQLIQLSQAPDPEAFASQTGMTYVDGMVRVIIELREGAALQADPAVQVEAQYQNMVQTLLSPADICRIAAWPEVVRMGVSTPPVAQ